MNNKKQKKSNLRACEISESGQYITKYDIKGKNPPVTRFRSPKTSILEVEAMKDDKGKN